MSNDADVTATIESSAPTPVWETIAFMKWTSERCSISTPFGVPVEPEV